MKLGKKSRQFILILIGLGIPLNYLALSFIFPKIIGIYFLHYYSTLLFGFVIFSTYYISYPLFIIKYPKNQNLEKKLYRDKISRFVLASYPSFLGFFLTLITFQIIYSIIGTACSVSLAILILFSEDISLKFIHLPSYRLYEISFFGWLFIISGIVNLSEFIFHIFGSYYTHSIKLPIMPVVGSFISIGIGIGILLLRNAVRIFVLIISWFCIIGSIIFLTMGLIENDPWITSPPVLKNLVPRILLSILLAIYFTRPGAKQAFAGELDSNKNAIIANEKIQKIIYIIKRFLEK